MQRAAFATLMVVLCLASGCTGRSLAAPLSSTPPPVQPVASCDAGKHRFVTAVSDNGRYFVDQLGQPILVHGDSPWSGPTDWSPGQAQTYFANREKNGFNASIISPIGVLANGGPSDDGATYDGIEPFVDGDILQWDEAYWNRLDDYFRIACEHGNTLFVYPIDGWNINQMFSSVSEAEAKQYGKMFAQRYSEFPNLAWMTGGDYFPETNDLTAGADTDKIFRAMLQGIREAGSSAPFSIQLGYQKSLSTDNPFWEPIVNWNFVYTYLPTYVAVLEAYERPSGVRDPRPALLGEANYEGENNQADTPTTTDETLRRQMLWALTSGAAGEFRGSDDWEFHPGWEGRLDSPAVSQAKSLHDLVGSWPWWDLVPDVEEPLVIEGRGTRLTTDEEMDVLANDYVTASLTSDGRFAVVFVPTERTIRLDRSVVPASSDALWVDPTDASKPGLPAQIDAAGNVASPGKHADGSSDWLLVIGDPSTDVSS